MKQILRSEVLAIAILMTGISATFASTYCFVLETQDCPQVSGNCLLLNGSTYPSSRPADEEEAGWSEHVSDGIQHCGYYCPGTATYKWLYYGLKKDPNVGHSCEG